jgi:hypothetical protein
MCENKDPPLLDPGAPLFFAKITLGGGSIFWDHSFDKVDLHFASDQQRPVGPAITAGGHIQLILDRHRHPIQRAEGATFFIALRHPQQILALDVDDRPQRWIGGIAGFDGGQRLLRNILRREDAAAGCANSRLIHTSYESR